MIPLHNVRLAHRTKMLHRIAAWPSACRFQRIGATKAAAVGLTLQVRTSEPRQTRELRLGGFAVAIDLQCEMALPPGTAKPEAEKDRVDIKDLAGEWRTYIIVSVLAAEGTDCYYLGLRTARTKPATAVPANFPRL